MQKTHYTILFSSIFTSMIFLASCGGGGSTPGNQEPNTVQGVFLDSAVEGFSYSSGTISGTTTSGGSFEYEIGQVITET